MNILDQKTARNVSMALHKGDIDALKSMLESEPELAQSGIQSKGPQGEEVRSLLHVATDYPGHFPRCEEAIALLIDRGADPNARFVGPHTETPLHWAVSCDDVNATDALLEAGADLEADGGVLTGGSPMDDAVIFAQWNAARRLLDKGAELTLWHAGALGILDQVKTKLETEQQTPDDVTAALWHSCRGGQLETAQALVAAGANIHWVGFDNKTPLDCAEESGNQDLVRWLSSL
ncbi:MAG: ankyrin repeat domain-containing protein [Pseudomonadota bacterium]